MSSSPFRPSLISKTQIRNVNQSNQGGRVPRLKKLRDWCSSGGFSRLLTLNVSVVLFDNLF